MTRNFALLIIHTQLRLRINLVSPSIIVIVIVSQSIRTPLRSLARPEIGRDVLLVRALGGETDGLDDPPCAARARGGTGRRDQEGVVCRAVARGEKRPPFSPADSPTSQKQHFVFIYIAYPRFGSFAIAVGA